MKLIFAGTPEFAAVILSGLLASQARIDAVYTQPDRAAGRGRKLRASAVKVLAEQHGVAVAQPRSLRDPQAHLDLRGHAPDLIIVAAYGLLLPPAVLAIPRLGCINVHASLLPRWRGAAPIQRAIEAGDDETGVCIMRMEKGLDTGPVIARRSCAIGERDTAGIVHDKLAAMGRDLLLQTLAPLASGSLTETIQDNSIATYAKRFNNIDARLDWRRDASDLDRQIRAFNPTPGAWTECTGAGRSTPTRLRVLLAHPLPLADARAPTRAAAGEVLSARDGELIIACGVGALALEQVQAAGKRAVSAREFVNARSLSRGDRLQ
jgi:methionyl-tRNA formyltransferase